MKVTKRGKVPVKVYELRCKNCGTEGTAKEKEGRFDPNPSDGGHPGCELMWFKCPVCKGEICAAKL